MGVAILQGDKKVIAYRQLYNVKRALGTKNLEMEMFGTANA